MRHFFLLNFNTSEQNAVLNILPIRDSAVPPGHPTVERAGPLLPALATNITLCLSTSSFIMSIIRLKYAEKGLKKLAT